MFFLRDGMNNLLCLMDSFGSLAGVLLVSNEEEIQEQMGGHVVSKCKEEEFEDISVTNFRFMEEILDVS